MAVLQQDAEEFQLCLSLAMSRSYAARCKDGERICVMVPLHDMANHGGSANVSFACTAHGCVTTMSPLRSASWWGEGSHDTSQGRLQAFALQLRYTHSGPQQVTSPAYCRGSWSHVYTAKCAIPAGTEIMITYGTTKSNLALLSMYGFCCSGNLADRLNLQRPDQHDRWGLTSRLATDLALLDATALQALARCAVAAGAPDPVGTRCTTHAAANNDCAASADGTEQKVEASSITNARAADASATALAEWWGASREGLQQAIGAPDALHAALAAGLDLCEVTLSEAHDFFAAAFGCLSSAPPHTPREGSDGAQSPTGSATTTAAAPDCSADVPAPSARPLASATHSHSVLAASPRTDASTRDMLRGVGLDADCARHRRLLCGALSVMGALQLDNDNTDEVAVLSAVETILDRELHAYSTSVAQDRKLFGQAPSLMQSTAIAARLERKQLMESALAFAFAYRQLSLEPGLAVCV